MSSPEKTSNGRKALKVAGTVAACLLGLVLLLTLLLLTVLEPYAARMLKKQVAQKTKGLYQLKFEDIDINLLSTTVSLQDVQLTPDTAVHRQQLSAGQASGILVNLQTPEFSIVGINLLDLILNKELSINKVSMQSPSLTLIKDGRVQSQRKATATQGSSNAGTSFIKSIEVGEIDIPDARVEQFAWGKPNQPIHAIPHLSLRVLGLELDSLQQQNLQENWSAEDVQVTLKAYAYTPTNSAYRYGLGLLRYSTKDEKLLLENLKLTPAPKATTTASEAKQMLYEVRVPSIEVTGLKALKAYHTKELQLAGVTITNAAVGLLENPNIPADTASLNVAELYAQASNYLLVVNLNELHITDARFIHRTTSPEAATVQQLEKLNVRLRDIRLDSATLLLPRENLPVQSYLVTAQNYRYSQPSSRYTYQVGFLELSSQQKHLLADSILVLGNKKSKGTSASTMVYDLQLPHLRITKLNLLHAYQTKLLDIGSISILAPAVDITYYPKAPQQSWQAIVKQAYEQISAFVSEVKLGQLDVQNIRYTLRLNHEKEKLTQKLEDGSLTLTGIHIDSTFGYQQEPRVPLEALVLQGRSYKHWMPDQAQTLAVGRFRYSTQDGVLSVNSINLKSDPVQNERMQQTAKASEDLFDLSAPLLRVTGFNLIEALNSGRLDLKEITLRQPDFSITKDRDIAAAPSPGKEQPAASIFKLLSPITVQAVRLENGTFTYRERREEIIRTQRLAQVTTTVTGVKLSPESLSNLTEKLPIDELRMTAGKYNYQSPDSVYAASLDSLSYSSLQQELFARYFVLTSNKTAHAQLKAANPAAASTHLFDVSADKFKVTGLDLIRSFETGRFNVSEILLTEPEVAILRDQETADRRAATATPATAQGQTLKQVNQVVDAFRVKQLRLTNGKFELSIRKDSVQKSHTLEQASVVLEDLRLVSLQAPDPLKMFDVDNIGLLVQNYSYLTPDSLYEFYIGEVRTSLREQTLVVDSLRLKPLFTFEEYSDQLDYASDRVDLQVPNILMQGFRLDALFNRQEIIASNINLNNLVVNFYRDRRVPDDPERQPPTFQHMLRNVAYPVQVDSVHLVDGKIVYSEISANGTEPGVLTLDHTMLRITNITNDSLLLKENSIIRAEGSTRFMGESTLKASFAFHMDHPEDLYTYQGTLEPMKFAAFNPLLEQLMFFRMKSGHISQGTFNVRATEHLAEGQVDLLYDDLYIQLIDKDDPNNPGLLLNAGSFLLNNLVIKDNNPSRLGNFRKGEINIARDHTKSVFNHISGALMSGVASSMMPGWIEKILSALVGVP